MLAFNVSTSELIIVSNNDNLFDCSETFITNYFHFNCSTGNGTDVIFTLVSNNNQYAYTTHVYQIKIELNNSKLRF